MVLPLLVFSGQYPEQKDYSICHNVEVLGTIRIGDDKDRTSVPEASGNVRLTAFCGLSDNCRSIAFRMPCLAVFLCTGNFLIKGLTNR